MDDPGDITVWLARLKQGDPQAAQAIWEAYFDRLVRLARRQLKSVPQRTYDDEDVAISAFNSFCQAAKRGRFPQLEDKHDLWKLLVTITARKAHAQRKRQFAEKRGGGATRGESVFAPSGNDDSPAGLGAVMGSEPTPEFAAAFNETVSLLLEQLQDPTLQDIVIRKMEGFTNEEIASAQHCATRTVERKLQRVRTIWQKIASTDADL